MERSVDQISAENDVKATLRAVYSAGGPNIGINYEDVRRGPGGDILVPLSDRTTYAVGKRTMRLIPPRETGRQP